MDSPIASADMRKDYRGAQLIRLLSIPQADGTFRESATLMDEMIRYCEQDVRAMRAVSKAMRDLSADELADYHVNERINDRGVLVDVDLCHAAIKYAEAEKLDIEALVVEITQGDVPSVRSPRMRNWVLERVGAEAIKLNHGENPDIICMDMEMPGMDGLALIRQARAAKPGLPVIVVTGDSSEASAIEALNMGVSAYITKPFRVPQVLEAATRALAS